MKTTLDKERMMGNLRTPISVINYAFNKSEAIIDSFKKGIMESNVTDIRKLDPDYATVMAELDAIRRERTLDALKRIGDQAKDKPIESRVAKYVQLRDARAASNKAHDEIDRAYKECLEAIEASFLASAHEQGVSGFKTQYGTVFSEEQVLASIADEAAFFNFVLEEGDLDFFERRIKVTHIREYAKMNGGRFPPGLNIFREFKMKVRRS